MGSALMPDYFKEKVNLFVAMGPVTNLYNIEVPAFRAMSTEWKETWWVADQLGAYDLLNANWLEEQATMTLCDTFGGNFCEKLLQYFATADPEVDNLDRFDVFLKDFPAG